MYLIGNITKLKIDYYSYSNQLSPAFKAKYISSESNTDVDGELLLVGKDDELDDLCVYCFLGC